MKNTGGQTLGLGAAGNVDPLTSGGAYTSAGVSGQEIINFYPWLSSIYNLFLLSVVVTVKCITVYQNKIENALHFFFVYYVH